MSPPSTRTSGSGGSRPETNFWKDVRDYLEKGDSRTNQTPPIAICPICREAELSIRGLPLSSGRTVETEPAMLLICGHMACAQCMVAWFSASHRQGQGGVRCPVCRHDLHYSGEDCLHHIHGRILPTNTDSSGAKDTAFLRDVPLTLPEGGMQPERCNACRREQIQKTTVAAFDEALRLLCEEGELMQEEWVDAIRAHMRAKEAVWNDVENLEKAEYPSWGSQLGQY